MKFFKSTLAIVALLAANSLFAAKKTTNTTTRAAAGAASAPVGAVALTYPAMLAKIKTMPAAQVVDNAGNRLQPAFVQSIMDNADLSSTEAEALLQAGVNMHATWSGNNAKDKEKLQSLNAQVSQAANPAVYTVKPRPAAPEMAMTPAYYDEKTSMLDQDYLNNRIKELMQAGKPSSKLMGILEQEFVPKMLNAWTARGMSNTVSLTKILRSQITDALQAVSEASKSYVGEIKALAEAQKAAERELLPTNQKDFYDLFYNLKTSLLNDEPLTVAIKGMLQEEGPDDVIDTLTTEISPMMNKIWTNLKLSNITALKQALRRQITMAVSKEAEKLQAGLKPLQTFSAIPDFYDNGTDLMDERKLANIAHDLINDDRHKNMPLTQVISDLQKDILDQMLPAWNEKNIKNQISKTQELNLQIDKAVRRAKKQQ